MAASLKGVFAEDLREKILNSKILVVGAGGIGCEVLKNLVMSGFPDIEIIDLDTIDVSNLNRQFLFHREHVGKSKALVARESALQFNPDVKIKAYHDSITSLKYDVNFYKNFNVVLSALDNRAARNHINRMCLTADVPLIESGTAGYMGQVELIKKGLTQCYECTPKARQVTYGSCTIRNTPSELIHCIVWAKHLFNQLFGETVDEEDISPDMADPEAQTTDDAAADGNTATNPDADVNADTPSIIAKEQTNGTTKTMANDEEMNENHGNVVRKSTRQLAMEWNYDPVALFNKFFNDDILYLLSMSNLWSDRKPPTPISWHKLFTEEDHLMQLNGNFEKQYHSIWSLKECASVFANCLKKLSTRYDELNDEKTITWDKDDQEAMDFVAACANIRAFIFEIATKSRFEIKSMAGNIIPAIASTNAMTAGLVVLQAYKILRGQFEQCTSVYVRDRLNANKQLLMPEKKLVPRNPNCPVCSSDPVVHLRVDTNRLKVAELRKDVLIKTLNMVQPEVGIVATGNVFLAADAEETEINDNKVLSELNIVNGTILICDDFFQEYKLSIVIAHFDAEHDQPLFEVLSDPEQLKPKDEVPAEKLEAEENNKGEDKDEDVGPSTSKRMRLEEPNIVNADEEDDDDLLIVEEDDDEEEEKVKEEIKDEIKDDEKEEVANDGEEELKEQKLQADDINDVHSVDEMSSDDVKQSDVVDLDSDLSSEDDYIENSTILAMKRKAPLAESEITEVLDSEEEQEAIAAKLNNDDGPTACKRSRSVHNNFNSSEVIDID